MVTAEQTAAQQLEFRNAYRKDLEAKLRQVIEDHIANRIRKSDTRYVVIGAEVHPEIANMYLIREQISAWLVALGYNIERTGNEQYKISW